MARNDLVLMGNGSSSSSSKKNQKRERLHLSSVAASESEGVHVLAVDDSLVDRKVIERLLITSSYKVTAVDSGQRALQFLGLDGEEGPVGVDGLKVDLIITDYCMPGMTGFELLKKIKGSSSFREIPVVIMSSENVLPRIDRCLQEGAEDFIVKPVKLSDVERLKGCMMREERGSIHKRKSREELSCDHLSSPPTSISSSTLSEAAETSSSLPMAMATPSTASKALPDSPSRRLKKNQQ